MKVSVSVEDQVSCDSELVRRIEGVLEQALEPFSSGLLELRVHLGEVAGANKAANDQSCRLEALPGDLPPIVALHVAPTLSECIHSAAGKLKRALTRAWRQAPLGSPATANGRHEVSVQAPAHSG